jgi:hypothetical protein
MTIVYTLQIVDGEDHEVYGVFTTEEKAWAAASYFGRKYFTDVDEVLCIVTPVTLDDTETTHQQEAVWVETAKHER